MAIHDISVVIRARDEAANIARCLDILAAQRRVGELQVILVDGGSPGRNGSGRGKQLIEGSAPRVGGQKRVI